MCWISRMGCSEEQRTLSSTDLEAGKMELSEFIVRMEREWMSDCHCLLLHCCYFRVSGVKAK
jgi:hypothetical protein